jgi:hypothetical protein
VSVSLISNGGGGATEYWGTGVGDGRGGGAIRVELRSRPP